MAVRRITTLQGPTLKADDGTTAATIADSTGQITVGATNGWTLPVNKGTNDKYVLQIDTTTAAANWVESLTAPEITSATFDDRINNYEAPYEYTATTVSGDATLTSMSSITGLLAGQYISGDGIPANTTILSITAPSTIELSADVTSSGTNTAVAVKIQKTPGEKNGGKVTITGTNFGATIAEISVAITNSGGTVWANASYLTALSSTSITAEWTGTEGTYSTNLTDAVFCFLIS